ncbi:hypothetical protein MATL_G00222410 [Megalops atlanticus]|uniref:Secretory calcium-binding phosphoprotein 9 n=1 Tax=Megalops atlanticus TaxID=7932 RepID=A0A9D3PEM5_MEGAT|nr:hypothetical protein MATL_G00222410 [Megalops atlanticus]
MKFLALAVFSAILFHVNSAKKLRLITGLNGGLVTGLNPGLVLGGVQPIGGGLGVIGQPQFGQVVPGVPTYLMPGAAAPFGVPFVPNMGVPQQFPGQGGLAANGAMPFYAGVPQQNAFGGQLGMNPPQQQGAPGDAGNGMQQQGAGQPGTARRFKRSYFKKVCRERLTTDPQVPTQITSTPTAAEDNPSPNTA